MRGLDILATYFSDTLNKLVNDLQVLRTENFLFVINFYFFEINRLSYLQRKSFNSYRFKKKSNFNNIKLEYFKLYNIETTLFSYQFFKL